MNHRDVVQSISNWFKKKENVELVSRFFRDFPSPDVFIQLKNGENISIECKPSNQSGREYLMGLGQAIAYFTISDYSYLALPQKELENYKKYFIVPEVGLLSVSQNTVEEKRKSKKYKTAKIEVEYPKRGYAYYRDLYPVEIYEILSCIKKNSNKDPKVIKKDIWETLRKMRDLKSQQQKTGWLINIQLFLRDLDLIDVKTFKLKESAEALLQFDIQKREEKKLFIIELSKSLLIEGNYIDIVGLFQEINDSSIDIKSAKEYKEKLIQKIYEEKLASHKTNVKRDIEDIIRIMRKLDLISDWDNKSKKYFVHWSKVLPLIKLR